MPTRTDPARTDPAAVRSTFARFPSGVAALSALVHEAPVVVLASSFQVGISLTPPLVLFAVQHGSFSWSQLRTAPRIGVSVLASAHRPSVPTLTRKDLSARFDGLETEVAATGAHYLSGAAAWMECSVHSETAAGDHDVVVLRVHDLGHAADVDPLVWHGSTFRTLRGTATSPDHEDSGRTPQ
ncbi:flavin reductase family protein [Kineococcus sp. TBRC 1896]|uniref:Flavin reductase family protein n=1 Tax=Kineococcus mangrovi TaxID=1660183 RepID=A0ABV4I4L8_9ACTN